jgi:hypothetical protein
MMSRAKPDRLRAVIRKPTSEIRAVFEKWLATESRTGARLVVLEGLMGSGKTTLTNRPFRFGTRRSLNIEIDQFFQEDTFMSPRSTYLDAINKQALQANFRAALASAAPTIVIEGPMAWPLVEPIAEMPRDRIRRVYLKRMMRLKPDFWIDQNYLADPSHWPPTAFHRSIYQYHAERRPWVEADLVLERIED